MSIEQILLYIIGVALIISGITKLGFNRRKAQRVVRIFGEAGTQILYIVLGIVIIVVTYITL